MIKRLQPWDYVYVRNSDDQWWQEDILKGFDKNRNVIVCVYGEWKQIAPKLDKTKHIAGKIIEPPAGCVIKL